MEVRTAGCAVCASMATSTVMTCVSGSRTASQRSANVYTGSVNRSDDARLSPKCRSIRSLLQRFFSSCSHAASRARARKFARISAARSLVAACCTATTHSAMNADTSSAFHHANAPNEILFRPGVDRSEASTTLSFIFSTRRCFARMASRSSCDRASAPEDIAMETARCEASDQQLRAAACFLSVDPPLANKQKSRPGARHGCRRRRCSAPIEPRSSSTGRRRRVVRRSAARAPRPRR